MQYHEQKMRIVEEHPPIPSDQSDDDDSDDDIFKENNSEQLFAENNLKQLFKDEDTSEGEEDEEVEDDEKEEDDEGEDDEGEEDNEGEEDDEGEENDDEEGEEDDEGYLDSVAERLDKSFSLSKKNQASNKMESGNGEIPDDEKELEDEVYDQKIKGETLEESEDENEEESEDENQEESEDENQEESEDENEELLEDRASILKLLKNLKLKESPEEIAECMRLLEGKSLREKIFAFKHFKRRKYTRCEINSKILKDYKKIRNFGKKKDINIQGPEQLTLADFEIYIDNHGNRIYSCRYKPDKPKAKCEWSLVGKGQFYEPNKAHLEKFVISNYKLDDPANKSNIKEVFMKINQTNNIKGGNNMPYIPDSVYYYWAEKIAKEENNNIPVNKKKNSKKSDSEEYNDVGSLVDILPKSKIKPKPITNSIGKNNKTNTKRSIKTKIDKKVPNKAKKVAEKTKKVPEKVKKVSKNKKSVTVKKNTNLGKRKVREEQGGEEEEIKNHYYWAVQCYDKMTDVHLKIYEEITETFDDIFVEKDITNKDFKSKEPYVFCYLAKRIIDEYKKLQPEKKVRRTMKTEDFDLI
jgi:X-linked retinitis pigmentosa GTPase regulator